MRRHSLLSLAALSAATVAALCTATAGGAERPVPPNPEIQLDTAIKSLATSVSEGTGPVLDNFRLVGHSGLGGGIDFGDVWAHGDAAYVGTRCGPKAEGGGGVRVVDISHPTNPTVVSTLPNEEFTRAEDVVVRHVSTPFFSGDLAVVGIQACFGSGHEGEVPTGLRFFDVTNPASPLLLSIWNLPPGKIGCHEIDLV